MPSGYPLNLGPTGSQPTGYSTLVMRSIYYIRTFPRSLCTCRRPRVMEKKEEVDIEECYQAALEVAQRAGKVASAAFQRENKSVQTKTSSSDLVTETDKIVEELIFSFLRERFPTHSFIGEESMGEEGVVLTSDPTWIVDPIDGTSNFVHRFPFTCVSIGLTIDKESVVGVIYNFVLNQLFAAKKGGGATMNGEPIHVSSCTESTQALLVTALGNHRPEHILRPKLDTILDLAKNPNPVHGIRVTGSAAVNMCLVACGQADAYYEYGIHCWDIAAGDIIVREAGGVCTLPTGDGLDIMKRAILCSSSSQLASQLIPSIRHVDYCTSQKD